MENDNIEHAACYYDTDRNKPLPGPAAKVGANVAADIPTWQERMSPSDEGLAARESVAMLAEIADLRARIAAGAPDRERSPYVLGVKPSNWAEQVAAGAAHDTIDHAVFEWASKYDIRLPNGAYRDLVRIAAGAPVETPNLRDLVHGMSVSVDVSTGEADATNRYFGTVNEVMEYANGKHGVVLLVADAMPNFAAQPAPVSAETALRELGPSCNCPSGNGSLRWPCPVHSPLPYNKRI